jgi:hypothetical protein
MGIKKSSSPVNTSANRSFFLAMRFFQRGTSMRSPWRCMSTNAPMHSFSMRAAELRSSPVMIGSRKLRYFAFAGFVLFFAVRPLSTSC